MQNYACFDAKRDRLPMDFIMSRFDERAHSPVDVPGAGGSWPPGQHCGPGPLGALDPGPSYRVGDSLRLSGAGESQAERWGQASADDVRRLEQRLEQYRESAEKQLEELRGLVREAHFTRRSLRPSELLQSFSNSMRTSSGRLVEDV